MSQNTGGSGAVTEPVNKRQYKLTNGKGKYITVEADSEPSPEEIKALFDQEYPEPSQDDLILNRNAAYREEHKPSLTLGDIGDIAMSPIAGVKFLIQDPAKKLADMIAAGADTLPNEGSGHIGNGLEDLDGGAPTTPGGMGLGAGLIENAGRELTSMASPVGLGMALIPGGRAAGPIGRIAQLFGRGAGLGFAGAGAINVAKDSGRAIEEGMTPEILAALAHDFAQTSGGLAGGLARTEIGNSPATQAPARVAVPILDAGARLADSKFGPAAVGAAVGGTLGHATHVPYMGYMGASAGAHIAKGMGKDLGSVLRDASARVKQSYKGPEGVLGELDAITKNPPRAPEDITADGLDPRVVEATRQIHDESPAVIDDDYNAAKLANSPLEDLTPDPKWQSEVDAIKAAQEQDRITNESQKNLAAKTEQSAKDKVQARKDAAKAKYKESRAKVNLGPRKMDPEIAKSGLTDNQKVMLDEAQATRDAILRGAKDPKKIQQANERFESKKKAILAQAN